MILKPHNKQELMIVTFNTQQVAVMPDIQVVTVTSNIQLMIVTPDTPLVTILTAGKQLMIVTPDIAIQFDQCLGCTL